MNDSIGSPPEYPFVYKHGIEYWWDQFMDTCFGEERDKLEKAIGDALTYDRELGKTYILIGEPGTGKTTILNLIYLLFQNDSRVHVAWQQYKIPHYDETITFVETNRLDESQLLEGDVVIHTTGKRLSFEEYREALELFQKDKLWISWHCLNKVYKESEDS